jgi:lipoate-protein ligase A
MIFIERGQTDPFFNIAAEEFLLKNTNEEILTFWQSMPSVILGKHQNPVKEVNLDFVNQQKIPVIRRISGGGTVFHDLGNINYTLITQSEKQENLVDFRKFTQPMILFLKEFGLESCFEGKNNLTLGGKKFSGNSAHVFKKRVMHHGTFLFETRLDILENIINPSQENIEDKSIESIQASVTNISGNLKEKITLESFKKQMADFFTNYFGIKTRQKLTEKMIEEIQKLAEEKYKKWSWNFGYAPKYRVKNEVMTPSGLIQVDLEVKDGLIANIKLFLDGNRLHETETEFLGSPHDKNLLLNRTYKNQKTGIYVEVLFP